MLREHSEAIRAELGGLGLELPENAYVFSNDPMGASPWNPDWATHKASDLAAATVVKLNSKRLRHYATTGAAFGGCPRSCYPPLASAART